MAPPTRMPAASNEVPIGRLMNGPEMFMALSRANRALFLRVRRRMPTRAFPLSRLRERGG